MSHVRRTDGVADPVDACSATAAAATANGCPARPAKLADSDGDGVPDATDKCPATPVAAVNDADSDGCADTSGPPTPGTQTETPIQLPAGPGGSAVALLATRLAPSWSAKAKFTTVRALRAAPVPAGAQIELRCKGKGCPFKTKKQAFATAVASANLEKLINRVKRVKGKRRKVTAKLAVKTTLEVRVTAPNRIGRSTLYTVRKSKKPSSRSTCLAPGTAAPVVCPA